MKLPNLNIGKLKFSTPKLPGFPEQKKANKKNLGLIGIISLGAGLILLVISLNIPGTLSTITYILGLLGMVFGATILLIWLFFMSFLRKSKQKKLEANAKTSKELITAQHVRYLRKRRRVKEKHLLKKYLLKAGYDDIDEKKYGFKIFRTALIIIAALTLLAILLITLAKPGILYLIVFCLVLWTFGLALVLALSWMAVYIYLDLRIYRRRQQIEEVLPDFLQLTSSNISAGMPIDRALWFAVRPRFGILAKEIEEVAKKTVAGEDLSAALKAFSDKYDSPVLSRSINLLLEGLAAGGEMAELLNKIAVNIQELKIMKKEMAASVMTYVIFITFAAILAAPFLFALATQLLIIITKIMGSLGENATGGGGGGMLSMSFNASAISIKDFKIFCMVMLSITAAMSAAIIATIRKGTIKEGFKNIPIYIAISLTLYLIANSMLGSMLGGFF
jgi:Flp pilus assembly protein TadB